MVGAGEGVTCQTPHLPGEEEGACWQGWGVWGSQLDNSAGWPIAASPLPWAFWLAGARVAPGVSPVSILAVHLGESMGFSTACFSPVVTHVEWDLFNKPILTVSCLAHV